MDPPNRHQVNGPEICHHGRSCGAVFVDVPAGIGYHGQTNAFLKEVELMMDLSRFTYARLPQLLQEKEGKDIIGAAVIVATLFATWCTINSGEDIGVKECMYGLVVFLGGGFVYFYWRQERKEQADHIRREIARREGECLGE